MAEISYQKEENFAQVIWEFLPGILKFLSFMALVGILIVGGQTFLNVTDTVEGYVFQPNLIRESTPVYGPEDAKITVVIASDFQCPACAYYDSIFRVVEKDYVDKVKFAYKDYPIEGLHPYAWDLAKGGKAANKQGKFLEFSNLAFDNQDNLNSEGKSVIETWAKQIEGLDVDKWNIDRNTMETERQIQFSLTDLEQINLPLRPNSRGMTKPSGQSLGTPTTIIMQGEEVLDWWTGAIDDATIRSAIDAQLNK